MNDVFNHPWIVFTAIVIVTGIYAVLLYQWQQARRIGYEIMQDSIDDDFVDVMVRVQHSKSKTYRELLKKQFFNKWGIYLPKKKFSTFKQKLELEIETQNSRYYEYD